MIEVVREILSTAEPAAPKPVEETEDTVPTASNLERAIQQEVRRREATPVEPPPLPVPLASRARGSSALYGRRRPGSASGSRRGSGGWERHCRLAGNDFSYAPVERSAPLIRARARYVSLHRRRHMAPRTRRTEDRPSLEDLIQETRERLEALLGDLDGLADDAGTDDYADTDEPEASD